MENKVIKRISWRIVILWLLAVSVGESFLFFQGGGGVRDIAGVIGIFIMPVVTVIFLVTALISDKKGGIRTRVVNSFAFALGVVTIFFLSTPFWLGSWGVGSFSDYLSIAYPVMLLIVITLLITRFFSKEENI